MTDRTRSRLARLKVKTRRALIWILVAAAVCVVLCAGLYQGFTSRQPFIYADHLDDTAVTIDGEELTFRDLAFYVVYEEYQVQKAALIYNPDNPWDFWDSHVQGGFVIFRARKVTMEMAIHDRLLLRMAQDEGVTLSSDEKEQLENRITDFYEDLYDEQRQNLPVSTETLDKTMSDIAVSEKYQQMLAQENDDTFASYGYDGRAYLRLKKRHKVKISDSWNSIRMGRITVNERIRNQSGYQEEKDRENREK